MATHALLRLRTSCRLRRCPPVSVEPSAPSLTNATSSSVRTALGREGRDRPEKAAGTPPEPEQGDGAAADDFDPETIRVGRRVGHGEVCFTDQLIGVGRWTPR